MTQLPKPHKRQRDILLDNSQVVAVAAGRRASKTTTAKLAAIEASVFFDKWIAKRGHPGLVLSPFQKTYVVILAPTRQQVKMLYWQFLEDLFNQPPFNALVKNINTTALTIDLHGNRPSIMLAGSNHEDGARLLGLKASKAIIDECQHCSWETYTETIRPALADTPGSQVLAMGTARRGLNTLRRLRDMAVVQPDLISFHTFTSYDNPYFAVEAIEREKLLLPPEIFAREFLCSFDEPDSTTIFTSLGKDNQVSSIPALDIPVHLRQPNQHLRYVMGVDWGSRNPGCAVFAIVPETRVKYYVDGWASPDRVIKESDQIAILKRFIDTYQIKLVLCDPSRPDAILSLRDATATEVKVGSGYNAVVEGTTQLHEFIYQNSLLFLTGKDTLIPKSSGGINAENAYHVFADYRYKIEKDGSVSTVEAPGRWEMIDCARYALTVDRVAAFNRQRYQQEAKRALSQRFN